MKTKTFARLALFFPYLILIESITYFVYHPFASMQYSSIREFNFIWNLLAVFWFVPYTIHIVRLLIWSKEKSAIEIQEKFENSPFELVIIAPVTYAIIFLIGIIIDVNEIDGLFWGFIILSVLSVFGSFILGHIFILIIHLLYKFLQVTKIIKD
jgi:ABC-type xylose transport system permease subunit